MFCVAALIPSPPALVPGLGRGSMLAGSASAEEELAVLRSAVLAAARVVAGSVSHWTIIGGADAECVIGPRAWGTFRGFGADIRVTLSPSGPAAATMPDPRMPLPALIGGWLRGRVAPEVVAEARLVALDTGAQDSLMFGRRLRGELDAVAYPGGVLVIGDGAATLSEHAPGYLDPRAIAVQDGIDRALESGDRAALAMLDPVLCAELEVSGRVAYQVLAGLFAADTGEPEVETFYRAAPFGVGYHVSVWRPGGGG